MLTFQDANGNPLPAAVRVDFYAGSAIAPNASIVESDYLQVGGTVTPAFGAGTYVAAFYGTLAPDTTVAFTYTEADQTITVSGYQSPTLSQTNFAVAQAKRWVRGAFGTDARQSGGVAFNLAYGLSYALMTLSQQIQQVLQAMRLPTSVGTSIDSWVQDFFGATLPRQSGETDSAYIARARSNLSAKKGLKSGIITIGTNYGATTVVEPWRASVTGAYDSLPTPTLAYDSLGCYGSQKPDVSVYIEPVIAFSTAQATQAKLAILGAKPAGIKTTVYEVSLNADGWGAGRWGLAAWGVSTEPQATPL